MAYYFVDDIDASLAIMQMLQTCSKYFPAPSAANEEELKQKMGILSKLHKMWTEDSKGDSSYQSEVYKRVCEMFSNNVFQHVPLQCLYSREDEIDDETMWELMQLNPVYRVLVDFLNLTGFDEEKLAPYADRTFMCALIRRLDCCVETERNWIKQILFLLFDKAPYSRPFLLKGTVDSLVNQGTLSIGGGVKELLEIFKMLIGHGLVESPTIIQVLPPLMKRDGLCHYASCLHECFETATRLVDADSPIKFLEYALNNWSPNETKQGASQQCRTLETLYHDACGPEQRSRVRRRLVDHVAARLCAADDVATCLAYARFCGRLVDGGECTTAELDRVAEAMTAVYRTHRDYWCVECAGHWLRRLVTGGGSGGRRVIGDAARLAAMEVLVADRSRAMTDDLVDDTF